MPLLVVMFLELVSTFFDDARRRSADDALWNGKREIYFKGSRLRYLATRDGMALAVRRCVTGFSSNRLVVAFLVDIHRTSVNRWELRFAAACMASRKAWNRYAQEKLYRPKESNHIDRVFGCVFKEETLPTQLSAEGSLAAQEFVLNMRHFVQSSDVPSDFNLTSFSL